MTSGTACGRGRCWGPSTSSRRAPGPRGTWSGWTRATGTRTSPPCGGAAGGAGRAGGGRGRPDARARRGRGEGGRAAYEEAGTVGGELILFAGASSIDPLDAAYAELVAAGGELLRQGAPAHPGSMLWLGRLDRTVVLGVASCAGFGRNTSLDLVLPFVFASGEADEIDFARLGYGGLIEAGAGRRVPPHPA